MYTQKISSLSSHVSPSHHRRSSFPTVKMFALYFAIQVLSFSIIVQAAAVSTVFESIKQLPRGWSFVRTANGTEPIKLRISLKQQNVDHFYEKLLEVSTPDHPNYGMHYEGHELRSLLQPRGETSQAVMNWLSENNITAIKDEGDYLLFSTDVFTANRMLKTEFGYYQARQSKQQVLRARSYSVPEEVRDHINFVQPTTRFGGLKPLSSMARILDEGVKSDGVSKWWGPRYPKVNVTCNATITPECLLNLYNVHYEADPDNGNTVGYASFLEEYARFEDLKTFEKVYAPYAANTTVRPLFALRELANQNNSST